YTNHGQTVNKYDGGSNNNKEEENKETSNNDINKNEEEEDRNSTYFNEGEVLTGIRDIALDDKKEESNKENMEESSSQFHTSNQVSQAENEDSGKDVLHCKEYLRDFFRWICIGHRRLG